jgi:hypothetical protein
MAKLIVVIEIFIAQGQPEDALGDQGADLVLHKVGIALVAKAGCEPLHQPDGPIGGAQKKL